MVQTVGFDSFLNGFVAADATFAGAGVVLALVASAVALFACDYAAKRKERALRSLGGSCSPQHVRAALRSEARLSIRLVTGHGALSGAPLLGVRTARGGRPH